MKNYNFHSVLLLSVVLISLFAVSGLFLSVSDSSNSLTGYQTAQTLEIRSNTNGYGRLHKNYVQSYLYNVPGLPGPDRNGFVNFGDGNFLIDVKKVLGNSARVAKLTGKTCYYHMSTGNYYRFRITFTKDDKMNYSSEYPVPPNWYGGSGGNCHDLSFELPQNVFADKIDLQVVSVGGYPSVYNTQFTAHTVLTPQPTPAPTKQIIFPVRPSPTPSPTPTPLSSVKLLSPNGGEQLISGEIYRIRWDASKDLTSIDLSLRSEGVNAGMRIATGFSNTGYYDWKVLSKENLPFSFKTDKLKLKLTGRGLREVIDESDNVFSILPCTDSDGGKNYLVFGKTKGVSPQSGQVYDGEDVCGAGSHPYAKEGQLVEHYCDGIYHTNTVYTCQYGCEKGACKKAPIPEKKLFVRMTSPNGGETLKIGETYRIKWDSQLADKVWIGYTTGPGSLSWIATEVPNQGFYDWKVSIPITTVNKFKISITAYQTGVGSTKDESDNFFTVIQQPPTPIPFPTNPPTPTPTPKCTDSDGGKNIFVVGKTSGIAWGTISFVDKKDECLTEGEKAGRLAEYYCDSGFVVSQSFGPEDGCNNCKDGACIKGPQIFTDVKFTNAIYYPSDKPAGDYLTISITNTGSKTINLLDYELALDANGQRVNSLSPSSIVSLSKTILAPGETSNIRLQATHTAPLFAEKHCTEDFGIALATKSGTVDSRLFSTLPRMKLNCVRSTPTPTPTKTIIPIPIQTPVLECIESDGGRDYYTQGTVIRKFGESQSIYSDSCNSVDNKNKANRNYPATAVHEMYCDKDLKTEYFDCQYGCENGACRKTPVATPTPEFKPVRIAFPIILEKTKPSLLTGKFWQWLTGQQTTSVLKEYKMVVSFDNKELKYVSVAPSAGLKATVKPDTTQIEIIYLLPSDFSGGEIAKLYFDKLSAGEAEVTIDSVTSNGKPIRVGKKIGVAK